MSVPTALNERHDVRPRLEQVVTSAGYPSEVQAKWTGFVARNLFRYKLGHSLRTDKNFQVSACSRTECGFTVARVTTTSGRCRLVRDEQLVAKEMSPRYVIYVSLRGDVEFSQFGRTDVCRPSSFAMLSNTIPFTHTKLGDNDTVCLLMPDDFVNQRLTDVDSKCARIVSARDGLGHLALHSLISLSSDATQMSTTEFKAASAIICDLALLAVAGCRDAMTSNRSARAANLARAKATIKKRLQEFDLSLQDVAAECGISLSYMHKLFRDDGQTAWGYLKRERLQRARQLMVAPTSYTMSVTDIALSSGFSNMSQFSTAFKQAFSVSPKEVLRGTK